MADTAATGTRYAADLDTLVAAQAVTGGAWGCVLMACFTAAAQLGRTGREGLDWVPFVLWFAAALLFAGLAAAAARRASPG